MGQRILLADRNTFELEKVASILQKEHDVFIAQSSEEVYALSDLEKIDMIFADLKMSMPDGKSLFLKLKEDFPNITRIILGGKEDDPAVFTAIQKNIAKTCFIKPWDNNVLDLVSKISETEKLIKDSGFFSLFSNLYELPTIRSSYQRILQLIDDDGEIADIANAIQSDPSMTAKLLRVANSAYYGLKSSSVKQAVTYLGLRNIRDLVLSSSIFDMFNKEDVPEKVFQPLWQQFFTSSKIVSSTYRLRAKRAPIHATNAGLLMNIGIIFLLKQFDIKYLRLIQMIKQSSDANPYDLESLELAAFGSTHSIIGGYLLDWWEIPYPIVEAALYHHDPFNENVIDKDLLCIMHLADYYSSKSVYMEESYNKVDDCFKFLNIPKAEFERTVSEL